MSPSPKILPVHLERLAYVYIRQSTMRQVEHNLESQDLQYSLVRRAQSLGWSESRVVVIDDDLGKSAITSAGRQGFQNLVAAVGLGQVGMILVTDVSRLARNCSDWYRLLDLASLYGALISDASGIFDPRIYDDRLLLGLKGAFSEAQWYSMRTQLCAAQMNKARRGELHTRLPVGLVRLADGSVACDPDLQVQSAIRLVFDQFERLGSAQKAMRFCRDEHLQLPRRTDGQIEWVRPSFQAIYAILKQPAYAGAYAYGKHHRTHLPGDTDKVVVHPLSREQWPVLIQHAWVGYISWEQYERNQERLHQNAQGCQWKGGAPREGGALLQGMALCGHCGRRLHVHYTHSPAYVCDHTVRQYGERRCATFTLAHVDPVIAELFLQAVQPARLQAALAALEQVESQRLALTQHWQQRLERARYEAHLARRRYEKVDPDLRLVAAELERSWEDKLRALAKLEKEWLEHQAQRLSPVAEAQRQAILRLANDLPALWQHASQAERKRLIRCLIADVTLDAHSQPGFTQIGIRWQTGAVTSLTVPRPRHGTPPALSVANRVRQLAAQLPDHLLAEKLNAEGFPTATGLPWTIERVRTVRRKHKIPTACPYITPVKGPRGDGLIKVGDAARRLGVNRSMITDWFHQGFIHGVQRRPGSALWVRLNQEDLHRLDGSASFQPGMISLEQALDQLDEAGIRVTIQKGALLPYRLRVEERCRWFLLTVSPPDNPTVCVQSGASCP